MMLRLLGSRFLSSIADQFLLFAVPLIIYKTTGSAALTGLAFGVEWLPRVISLPIAGVLSDRLGSRKVFLTADLVRAAACVAGFLAWRQFSGEHGFLILTAMSGVVAFFYAQGFIALEASLPRILPVSELPKIQAWFQGIDQLSSIAGPLIASILALALSSEHLILAAGAMFSVAFLTNLGLPEIASGADSSRKPASIREDLALALGHVRNRPELVRLIGYTVIVNLMYGASRALSAPMTTGTFGMSDQHFGLLNAISGGVTLAVLAAVPWLTSRLRFALFGALSFLLIVLSSAATGLAPGGVIGFAIFAAAIALLNGGDALFNVYIRTERAKVIPKEDMGKTIGLIVCINQLSIPLSGFMIARLAPMLGNSGTMLAITAASIALSVAIWLKGRAYEVARTAPNSVS